MVAGIDATTTEDIFDEGLHQFLGRNIKDVAALSNVVHETYLSGDTR
jgi:uncharacterized alpha-E superfamily protein